MDIAKQKKRDANFELLRIIAMIFIIFSHQAGHGVWFSPDVRGGLTINKFFCNSVFFYLGFFGNWFFILISGYFLSEKSFSWKKVIKLWVQVLTISFLIALITWISKIYVAPCWDRSVSEIYAAQGFFSAARTMTIKDWCRSLMPVYCSNNWYATSYLVFFILSPFLNLLVSKFSQNELKRLIIILIILGTVLPLLPREEIFNPSSIFPFILGFFIAKYIRLYNPAFLTNKKRNVILALMIFIFLVLWSSLSSVLLDKISFGKNFHGMIKDCFASNFCFPVMVVAVLIFCTFRDIKIPYNPIINLAGGSTFGVYLIHGNLLIIRWWFHAVCKLDNYVNSGLLIPYMCFCTILTFIVCSLFELLRKNTIERLMFPEQ
jgi:hypothetical protein